MEFGVFGFGWALGDLGHALLLEKLISTERGASSFFAEEGEEKSFFGRSRSLRLSRSLSVSQQTALRGAE